jgi:hypothetical protein
MYKKPLKIRNRDILNCRKCKLIYSCLSKQCLVQENSMYCINDFIQVLRLRLSNFCEIVTYEYRQSKSSAMLK